MMPKKEQFQFQEIGKRIMKGASEKGAEVAYPAALDCLTAQLIEDGSCRIVDLILKNLEQADLPVSGRLRRRMGRDSF